MSQRVFLPDPLGSPDSLFAVLGREVEDGRIQSVKISGYKCVGDKLSGAVALAIADDEEIHGVTLAVDTQERARLSHYLSAHPGSWQVLETAGFDSGCLAWISDLPAAEHQDPPQPLTGDLAAMHAGQLMQHFGQTDLTDIRLRSRMLRQLARKGRVPLPTWPDGPGCEFGQTDVELRSYDRCHNGFYALDEMELRHKRFDGGLTQVLNREILVSIDATILLPFDPVHDRVLLLEQFRPGPFLHNDPRPWILEPVAGRIDAGETAEQAAHREAEEEAGLTLKSLEWISTTYPSPGLTNECYHCYLGLCDLPETGGNRGGVADEGEDILTHVMSYHTLMELVDQGAIRAGPLLICALWLARHRERLRAGA